MEDEVITKRLHVSGLTPAIRPTDLSQKLGSFGTIKSLDGFEKLDGLGQPRKFGYVTIETTKSKLARCMNLLSGVTWKGAKLRIGEAKPDFRERIAREHAAVKAAEEEPPRKKRRLPRGVQGIHASDMSIVTPENASTRPGWKVTALGRIVKPIRMRPDHPLPETLEAVANSQSTKGAPKVKRSKKVKAPPVRARRKTIDPTKWGSQHIKGVFLDNVVATPIQPCEAPAPQILQQETSSEESGTEDEEEDSEEQIREEPEEKSDLPPQSIPIEQRTAPPLAERKSSSVSKDLPDTDLAQEKDAALGLLQSIFGDQDEWGGAEPLDSDIDVDASEDAQRRDTSAYIDAQDEVEEVPMDVDQSQPDASAVISEPAPAPPEGPSSASAPSNPPNLKDLFAPREEEGGFSLLGHLDLDLDLDDDVLDASFAPAQPAAPPPTTSALPVTTIHSTRTKTQVTFDPHLPLFFPLPQDEREGFRGKIKDPLDVAKEKGWDWREFCRNQTPEEIRQRWEEQKVELTRDWKRRHREAVKSRRRRGGGDGE